MEAQCYELKLNKDTLEKAGVEISGHNCCWGWGKIRCMASDES